MGGVGTTSESRLPGRGQQSPLNWLDKQPPPHRVPQPVSHGPGPALPPCPPPPATCPGWDCCVLWQGLGPRGQCSVLARATTPLPQDSHCHLSPASGSRLSRDCALPTPAPLSCTPPWPWGTTLCLNMGPEPRPLHPAEYSLTSAPSPSQVMHMYLHPPHHGWFQGAATALGGLNLDVLASLPLGTQSMTLSGPQLLFSFVVITAQRPWGSYGSPDSQGFNPIIMLSQEFVFKKTNRDLVCSLHPLPPMVSS